VGGGGGGDDITTPVASLYYISVSIPFKPSQNPAVTLHRYALAPCSL